MRAGSGLKLRRKFANPEWFDGLALGFQSDKTLIQSVLLIFLSITLHAKSISRCFLATVYRERVDKASRRFRFET